MAFSTDRDGGDWEIYIMNVDGSGVRRLTDSPGDDGAPAFSPDGQTIAFASARTGNYNIYVTDADGGGTYQVTADPADESEPHWAPTGVQMSDDPWLGPPFCARDTNADGEPDLASTTFSAADGTGYVLFPFRNMQDGMSWTTAWKVEGGTFFNVHSSWDGGESGMHFAPVPLSGTGDLVIQLLLDPQVVQEVDCPVLAP
jgi:dipeptidyl aminopeptidase/acylaminoacyl peptidase